MKREIKGFFTCICLIVSSLLVLVGCGKNKNPTYYSLSANVAQPSNETNEIIYGMFKNSMSQIEKGESTYYEVYIPEGYSSNNLKVKLNNTELSYESTEKYVTNINGNHTLVTSFTENDELKGRFVRYAINNVNSDTNIEVDASSLEKTKLNITYDLNSNVEFYEEIKEVTFENSTTKIKTIDLLNNNEYYKKLTVANKKVTFEYGNSVVAKFDNKFIDKYNITLNDQSLYFNTNSNYIRLEKYSLTSKINNELHANENKVESYYPDSFTIDFYNDLDKNYTVEWYMPTSSTTHGENVEINGQNYSNTIVTGPGSGRLPYVNAYSQKEGYRGALMYIGEETIETTKFDLKNNDIINNDKLFVFGIRPMFGINYSQTTMQKIYNNTKVKLGNTSITLVSSNSKIVNNTIYVWFTYDDIKDLIEPAKMFTYYANNNTNQAMAIYGGAILNVDIDTTNMDNVYSLNISKDVLSNKYIEVSVRDAYTLYTPLVNFSNKLVWVLDEEVSSTSTKEITLKVKFPSFYDFSRLTVSAIVTNNAGDRTEDLSRNISELIQLYNFDVATFKITSTDQLMSDTTELYGVINTLYTDTSNVVAYRTAYGYKITKNEDHAHYYYILKQNEKTFVYELEMKAEDYNDSFIYGREWKQVISNSNTLETIGLYAVSQSQAVSTPLELTYKISPLNKDTLILRYNAIVKGNKEKKKLDFSEVYKDPSNSEIEFYILKDLEGNTSESDMVLDSSDKWIHVTSSNYESVEVLTSSNNKLYMYININSDSNRLYAVNEFKENLDGNKDYYDEGILVSCLNTYIFDQVKVTKDNKEFTLFNTVLEYEDTKEYYINNNLHEVKTFVIIK